nr:hypothetical protein [uncultured Desulfobulbus sp.]
MDSEGAEIADCLPPPQRGFVERRVAKKDRRRTCERRCGQERRRDNRLSPARQAKTLKEWFRSVTHLRLGVDRRKNRERRLPYDRRQANQASSLLSPEELADLLS